jgi:hypothetical protein
MLRNSHRASPAPAGRGQRAGSQAVRRLAREEAPCTERLVPVGNIAVFTCGREQVFVMFLDWNIEAADERHAGPARKATARLR